MKLRDRIVWSIIVAGMICVAASPALAQFHGGGVTVHYWAFSPVVAIIAGILILIFPRILNYVVAIYLIIVGIAGLVAR